MASHLLRSTWQPAANANRSASTGATGINVRLLHHGYDDESVDHLDQEEASFERAPTPSSDAVDEAMPGTQHHKPYEMESVLRLSSSAGEHSTRADHSDHTDISSERMHDDDLSEPASKSSQCSGDSETIREVDDGDENGTKSDEPIAENDTSDRNGPDQRDFLKQQRRHSSLMCDELENSNGDGFNAEKSNSIEQPQLASGDYHNHHHHHHHQDQHQHNHHHHGHGSTERTGYYVVPSKSMAATSGDLSSTPEMAVPDYQQSVPILDGWRHRPIDGDGQFHTLHPKHDPKVVSQDQPATLQCANFLSPPSSMCGSFQGGYEATISHPSYGGNELTAHKVPSYVVSKLDLFSSTTNDDSNPNSHIHTHQQQHHFGHQPQNNDAAQMSNLSDSHQASTSYSVTQYMEPSSSASASGETVPPAVRHLAMAELNQSQHYNQQQQSEAPYPSSDRTGQPVKHDLSGYYFPTEYFDPTMANGQQQHYGAGPVQAQAQPAPPQPLAACGGTIMANFNKFDCGGELIEYQPAFVNGHDAAASARYKTHHHKSHHDQCQTNDMSNYMSSDGQHNNHPCTNYSAFYQPGQSSAFEQQCSHSTTMVDAIHGAYNVEEQQVQVAEEAAPAFTDLDEHAGTFHLFDVGGSAAGHYQAGSSYATVRYDPHHYGQYSQPHGFDVKPALDDHPLDNSGGGGESSTNYAECPPILYHSLDQADPLLPAVNQNYDPTAEISLCLSENNTFGGEHDDSSGADDDDEEEEEEDEDEDSTTGDEIRRRPAKGRSTGVSKQKRPVSLGEFCKASGLSTAMQKIERKPGCRPDTIERLRRFLMRRSALKANELTAPQLVAVTTRDTGKQPGGKASCTVARPGMSGTSIKAIRCDPIPACQRQRERRLNSSGCGGGGGGFTSSGKSTNLRPRRSSPPKSTPCCTYAPYMSLPRASSSGVLTRAGRRLMERSTVCT